MRVLGFMALGLLLLVPGAASVLAQPPAPVVAAELDPCVPVDPEQFQRLLSIELGTSIGADPARAAASRIAIGCVDEGVELRLSDAVTRKSMVRVLPRSSFNGPQSARLLALACAEFVVASWIELEVQPEPVVEPVGPRVELDTRAAVQQVTERRTRRARSSELSMAVEGQLWPMQRDFYPVGFALRAVGSLLPLLSWMVGGDFVLGRAEVSPGVVEVGTVSFAAALALRASLEPLVLRAGLGGRVGAVRIAGEPSEDALARGDSFVAAWGGPIAWGRGALGLVGPLQLVLELEAGLATLPAGALDEADELVFALDAGWLAASLGVGAAF